MRYTVVLESTNEPNQPGWYYAYIPALDLTTHGFGVDGAIASAKDLAEGWVAELKARGERVPVEGQGFVSHIEVSDGAVQPA